MDIICLSPLDNVIEIKKDLDSLGNLIYVPSISKEDLIELISSYPSCYILCNPNVMEYRLDESVLSSNISVISTASTGIDHIDIDLCERLGINVFSLADNKECLSSISSTAEMAFGLMISLIRSIPSSFDSVKEGVWDQVQFTGHQLNTLTIGIIGYGRLGTKMARYCDSFGMNVVVCDPYDNYTVRPKYSLEKIAEQCDIVSLHIHLNDETKHMIGSEFFTGRVKYLINTSRGAIVNEDDIITALEKGSLKGYATDVLEGEFGGIADSELIKRSFDLNIIITPHIAGTTYEAHETAYRQAVTNMIGSL